MAPAVQLHSWFVEPIRPSSSSPELRSATVRVWGRPHAASKPWWRSSRIASAHSATHLTTTNGTSVRLHGPLCDAFAARVNMSASGVELFRNGFPPAWRSLLSRAFPRARAPAPLAERAVRRAAVAAASILRKRPADAPAPPRPRKRVRFDVQLRPALAPDRPRGGRRPLSPRSPTHIPRPALASQPRARRQRRAQQPPAKTLTPHASAASSSPAASRPAAAVTRRAPKTLNNNSTPASEKRVSHARVAAKSATRRLSAPSKSTAKSHDAADATQRKPSTARQNTTTVRKQTVSDTRIAVPIEQSAHILRVRTSKRLPCSPSASSQNDKENSHPNVNAATAQSPAPRKPLVHAASSKLEKGATVRRPRAETRLGVQPNSAVTLPASIRKRRRSVSEPPPPSKPVVQNAECTPRRSRRIQQMTSKSAQIHPGSTKAHSLHQLSTSSGRTKANTKRKRVRVKVELVPAEEHVVLSDRKQSSRQRTRMRATDLSSKANTTVQDRKPLVQRDSTQTKSSGATENSSSIQSKTTDTKHIQRSKRQKSAPRKRLRSSAPTQSVTLDELNENPTEASHPSCPVPTDANVVEKGGAAQQTANTTGPKLAQSSRARRRSEQNTHRLNEVCKKGRKSRRGGSVTFADVQVRETRLQKKLSFEKRAEQTTNVNALSVSKDEWTQEQREGFEIQRNRVPANAPRYWESIAAGVRGKTAEQCLQLWDSTWCSPLAQKRKRVVSFTPAIADEPAEKKAKLSTPQAVRNVQKGSKTKRGRNTAKYRIAVRRLADTVARDTEDDALEPEIRTPVGSSKMTGGLFGIPDLQDGTPGTEVRQRRRNAEKGGERATPEILKRGKSFGLHEADQYVSLFRQRLGNAPIVATLKKDKPGVNMHVGMKAPLNIAPLPLVSEDLSQLNTQDSDGSALSDDGDLFF